MSEHQCSDVIHKAIRKGRAHWVCCECGVDVSLMFVLYAQAVDLQDAEKKDVINAEQ